MARKMVVRNERHRLYSGNARSVLLRSMNAGNHEGLYCLVRLRSTIEDAKSAHRDAPRTAAGQTTLPVERKARGHPSRPGAKEFVAMARKPGRIRRAAGACGGAASVATLKGATAPSVPHPLERHRSE